MEQRNIYITEFDKDRLLRLIAQLEATGPSESHVNDLSAELARAQVVASEDVPAGVVTMNSKVCLQDIEASDEMTFTLVFPDDADFDEGRISVLAPVGTAILGYSEGDVIEWKMPSGVRSLRIVSVLYQPEAAGDFDL